MWTKRRAFSRQQRDSAQAGNESVSCQFPLAPTRVRFNATNVIRKIWSTQTDFASISMVTCGKLEYQCLKQLACWKCIRIHSNTTTYPSLDIMLIQWITRVCQPYYSKHYSVTHRHLFFVFKTGFFFVLLKVDIVSLLSLYKRTAIHSALLLIIFYFFFTRPRNWALYLLYIFSCHFVIGKNEFEWWIRWIVSHYNKAAIATVSCYFCYFE